MKVSVVMPVYNGGERMRRTLDSVLAQTWRDFELVCVDDGSTDGISAAILDEYAGRDGRIEVVHQTNQGSCAAKNKALRIAQGDFVVRCDQDDLMHPQELEFCVNASREHDLDFLSFRYKRMPKDGAMPVFEDVLHHVGEVVAWDAKRQEMDPLGYRRSMRLVHTDSWAQFVRRDLAVATPIAEDWELARPFKLIRMSRRWASTVHALYFYDDSVPTSMTRSPFTLKKLRLIRDDLRNVFDLYEDVRDAGDPFGEWDELCRSYVTSKIKSALNKIRRGRRRKTIGKADAAALFKELAGIVHEVFFEQGVPFRYASLRHQLSYLWLMFKYRNYISEVRNG